MRALLINPAVGYYTRSLSNPLGLLSIGTYLEQNGHSVHILDRCVEKSSLNSVLSDFKPNIIGISVMSSRGLKDAIKVSKIASCKNIPVVWGGQLPTMQPELVLKSGLVDYISMGEGEETWLELLQAIEKEESVENVPGLAFLKNHKPFFTACRPFMDLSKAPVLNWELIKTEKYMQPYLGCHRMMYIYSSKGCPFNCAFCSNVSFHKSTHRKRPNENVIKEIKYLIDNYKMDGVYFSDELWCTRKSDMYDFCEKIHKNHLDFHWGVQLRLGMFDETDFQIMYNAGCRWIFFGIESGSEKILKSIHKNIELEKAKPTFDSLKRIGITSIASFIVGFPDETVEDLRETIKLIHSINANLTPIYHFTPLPATELFCSLVSNNKFQDAKSLKELSRVIATESVGTNFSNVPDRDLRVIRSWFHWKGFTNKNAYSRGRSFAFACQTIVNGLHSISLKGPISFLNNGFLALYEFLYVFWYSHAYKKTIIKYGLNK